MRPRHLVLLVPLCAAFAGASAAPPDPVAEPALSWQQARVLADVIARLRAEYVDPVDEATLVEGAIRGMLGALDAHSSYLGPVEQGALDDLARGTRDGVGLDLAGEERGLRVLDPLAGSPAERAGLKRGDLVLAVDGTPVAGLEPGAGALLLRGKPGSPVTVQVERPGLAPFAITLERERVAVPSVVVTALEPGLAHLRVTEFSRTTAAELTRGLARLERDGPLVGAVLDLRGNGGGLFDAAVDVADLFLDDGAIVSAEGRAPDADLVREATPGDLLAGRPIVLLVDGATASAAEIVAGALQDRHRGPVLGSRTHGKGSVQTVIPLARGGAIKFTSARYLTPVGRSIQDAGIEPDLPFGALPPLADATPGSLAATDPALARALAALKAARLARATP